MTGSGVEESAKQVEQDAGTLYHPDAAGFLRQENARCEASCSFSTFHRLGRMKTSVEDWRAFQRWLIPFVTILALTVCGPDANDSVPGREMYQAFSPMEADEAFGRLEEKLLALQRVEVRYHITSQGAFAADLEGALRLEGEHDLSLTGHGTFGGGPASVHLTAAPGWMTGGNQNEAFEGPAPAGLREAVVVGLTRMGLLHNLARLVAGAPPDRADGTVREWVEVREVDWVVSAGEAPGARGIHFQIWVAGQPAGEAALWLDERGLPVLREQVVRFPGGEMRVTERYEVE